MQFPPLLNYGLYGPMGTTRPLPLLIYATDVETSILQPSSPIDPLRNSIAEHYLSFNFNTKLPSSKFGFWGSDSWRGSVPSSESFVRYLTESSPAT